MIDLFYVTSRKYRNVFSLNCSVREQLTFPTIFDISYSYFRHSTVPLENIIPIFAPPCNWILYMFWVNANVPRHAPTVFLSLAR